MKHNITIDRDLNIHPVEGFEQYTQHSVGTKFIAALLDGWELAAGENLFIAFEKADKSNKLDAIIMGHDESGLYFTVLPDEVIHDDGDWTMCIVKMFNWNRETGKAENYDYGVPFEFTVIYTIRDAGGEQITRYDLANLQFFQHDILNGLYAARSLFAYASGIHYGLNELVFYPDKSLIIRSLKSSNTDEPYSDEDILSDSWEILFDYSAMEKTKEAAQNAQIAATQAKEAAEEAGNKTIFVAMHVCGGDLILTRSATLDAEFEINQEGNLIIRL